MKKLILLPLLFVFRVALSQENLVSNGFNISSICTTPCLYFPFKNPVYFPFEEDKEWQINNFEVAIKPSGQLLTTGDLYVLGLDTAINLQIEIMFFGEDNQTVHILKPDMFEFFNEANHAEPIVFSGQIPKDAVSKVKYVDIGITSSERVPYYEISSSCFLPCKNLKLKDEIKAFKKKK